MDHFQNIYQNHAESYHRLIQAEDREGNLLKTISQIVTLEGAHILDLGSGTGRFPIIFANHVDQITGLDISGGMLLEQKKQTKHENIDVNLVQGDIKHLPFESNFVDILISGWVIGHFPAWSPENWMDQVRQTIKEMTRVVRRNGTIIIIETLSTGEYKPHPPTEELGEYYSWLENYCEFSRYEIATDYKFNSLDESMNLSKFFFGAELSDKVRRNNWICIPEWTGLWVRYLE